MARAYGLSQAHWAGTTLSQSQVVWPSICSIGYDPDHNRSAMATMLNRLTDNEQWDPLSIGTSSTSSPFLWRVVLEVLTMMILRVAIASTSLLIATGIALAQGVTVDINRISDSGVGEKIGTVLVTGGKG
jgi:hypothetical protein